MNQKYFHLDAFEKNNLQLILLDWYKLSREQRKCYDWSLIEQSLIRKFLFAIFSDLDFEELTTEIQEFNQVFQKLISSVLKMREINYGEFVLYDLSENFIFVLKGRGFGELKGQNEFGLNLVHQKYTNMEAFTNCIETVKTLEQMSIIEAMPYQNWKKIRIGSSSSRMKILVAENMIIERFKQEIIKNDYDRKIEHLNHHLFCGNYPPYSIKTVKLQKFKRNEEIPITSQKILILYKGSIHLVVMMADKKNTIKMTLSNGAILSEKLIRKVSEFQTEQIETDCQENNSQATSLNQRTFIANSDCVLLSMPYQDFYRCLKGEDKIKDLVLKKLDNVMQHREVLFNRGKQAQNYMKKAQQGNIQVMYSIKCGRKNSRAFRRRKTLQVCEYEEFMTYDKYDIITRNKQKVEKKHELYSKLNQMLKQKKQQQRFLKTIQTEQGFKEVKKKELSMRLKRTRIDNLANKASIGNPKKYREKSMKIQFYFQGYNEKKTPHASTYKRWISTQQVDEKMIEQLKDNKQNRENRENKEVTIEKVPSLIFKRQVPIKRKQSKNKTCVRFRASSSSKRCSISQL